MYIRFNIVGTYHRGPEAQKLLKTATSGTTCELVREPDNPHDNNAIAVSLVTGSGLPVKVGYIARGVAEIIAPQLDARTIFGKGKFASPDLVYLYSDEEEFNSHKF